MNSEANKDFITEDSDGVFRLFDTHAHLDLDDFEADRLELITRSRQGIFPKIPSARESEKEKKGERKIEIQPGIFSLQAIVCPGITAESSRGIVELSRSLAGDFPGFFHPGVGIHPNHAVEAGPGDWNLIEELSARPEVAAIGETGLDRHWNRSPIELQTEFLLRHFDLARRRNLPVIIHCREAENDLLPILRHWRANERGDLPPLRGVVHSFSGGPEMARELIDLDFYLGFAGGVTWTGRKFAPIGEAAKIVPADRFLLETDSPFLVPHPFRGKLERNEPLMTAFIARKLAEVRQTTTGQIVRQTAENARCLFGR